MASLNIRKLDDETHTRLRIRAAQHGRSMEEEARRILRAVVSDVPPPQGPEFWEWLGDRAKERAGGEVSSIDSTGLIREDRDA